MQQPDSFESKRVAFLCQGVMGGPMAGHLARGGHAVTVYNRTRDRAIAWCEAHSEYDVAEAATPAAAVRNADFIFACSGADPDLEAVVFGRDFPRSGKTSPDGAISALRAGSIFVDHTTASAEVARRLSAALAEQGVAFLDAPVSGGQAGAEQGVLTVMLGGAEAAYERVVPLLECYAKKHLLLGPVGSGQLTKMVNQICIAGLLQALSEGLLFASSVGLDPKRVVEVISEGAAGSWQMSNRAETMIDGEFDFGFAVDWMRKDLGMVLSEAAPRGIPLPVTEIVDSLYAEVQRIGGGRLDTSSLLLALTDRMKRETG